MTVRLNVGFPVDYQDLVSQAKNRTLFACNLIISVALPRGNARRAQVGSNGWVDALATLPRLRLAASYQHGPYNPLCSPHSLYKPNP